VKSDRPKKKTIIGTVISHKMDKTVIVEWERRKMHPIYKKFVKQLMKVKAHDSKNAAAVGDLVKIIECRPVSKEKTWRVVEILEQVQRGQ